ncbi:MAG: OsmC family protein [Kiloniellales bacterium]|nr:OsmC family protein [Kiloniellales bacterium]
MPVISVTWRRIKGTEAALGWAGPRSVVADRPAGKAGGQGLGFNGGELLALAIGGCFCNDLQYVAHDRGVRLTEVEVEVTLQLQETPLLVTGAAMTVRAQGEGDVEAVIAQAQALSTVSNSIARGFPVTVSLGAS